MKVEINIFVFVLLDGRRLCHVTPEIGTCMLLDTRMSVLRALGRLCFPAGETYGSKIDAPC